jgi:hypothetical protein
MVTVVFTSCGRFHLLERTFKSFIEKNTYPIEKIIIIENSGIVESEGILKQMISGYGGVVDIIINKDNIGQVRSIDKAYGFVGTEYIFHCEDDWEFIDTNFIEQSIDVLKHDEKISNINLRIRFDGERGSMHPIEPFTKQTESGTIYHEYVQNYLNEWHGFSWNPGLRRLSDYQTIKPYINYTNEQGVGQKYKDLGFKAACLEKFYCKHIGQNSITLKSNM